MAVKRSLRCSYSVTLTSVFACLLQHTAGLIAKRVDSDPTRNPEQVKACEVSWRTTDPTKQRRLARKVLAFFAWCVVGHQTRGSQWGAFGERDGGVALLKRPSFGSGGGYGPEEQPVRGYAARPAGLRRPLPARSAGSLPAGGGEPLPAGGPPASPGGLSAVRPGRLRPAHSGAAHAVGAGSDPVRPTAGAELPRRQSGRHRRPPARPRLPCPEGDRC